MAVSNLILINHEVSSPVKGTERGPSALCQLPSNELLASPSLAAVLLIEFAVYFMNTAYPTPNGVSTQ